ncbi:hypothetical protein HMPREF1394_01523 [Helicobacter pylori GAM105Ai]|nr:hypothetical protein HMPREF1394_01523 [Helicobacter pylori GAM105Ai]
MKNTQKHQFDYQYPTKIKPKIFTCFYMKCVGMSEVVFNSINRYISKIFAQQNLKLIVTNRYHKKAKKLKV